ncbi:unnamed protein product [Brachionus calyciflorus]|uniref:Uncharacterized protein n=1 Tax=Brachionus calyciflorus TaxID=104777 RepID=A0A814FIS7_9BILA|nr:unnamed protein product [Brachionus calyciflorus]
MIEFQKHSLIQICSDVCINNKNLEILDDSEYIFFKKNDSNVNIYSGYMRNCQRCKHSSTSKIKLNSRPPFLFIKSIETNININDIPKNINVDGLNYSFLCTTIHKRDHFRAIFEIKNNLYLVNDLNKTMMPNIRAFAEIEPIIMNLPTTYSLFFLD